MELICTRNCSTCRKAVALLRQAGVAYRYREYRQERLDENEIREVLAELGVPAREVLRRHDRATRELGLTGDEPEEQLIHSMSEHPTLLQRPIGRLDGRAVVGRPPERLLELLEG